MYALRLSNDGALSVLRHSVKFFGHLLSIGLRLASYGITKRKRTSTREPMAPPTRCGSRNHCIPARGDTLRHPAFVAQDRLRTFDCVVANPLFSLKEWGVEEWATPVIP